VRFDLDALGAWTPDRELRIERDRIAAYAAATNETDTALLAGELAPPVFAVVPVWETIHEATHAVVPDDARPRVLHGEQDMFLHAPLRPDMVVRSRSAVVGVHPKSSGTTVVVKAETRDRDGALLNEQYATEFYRGIVADEGGGEAAPDHRSPEDVVGRDPVATVASPIDEDQTFRYAEASGDHFSIHLDDDFARAAGLPGIIVHGLCLMAFTGRAALQSAGAGPAELRRLAVRFARPVRPGQAVTTRLWQLAPGAFAYDVVDGDGETVIRDGRAELAES
jgi:acyl dehydratase